MEFLIAHVIACAALGAVVGCAAGQRVGSPLDRILISMSTSPLLATILLLLVWPRKGTSARSASDREGLTSSRITEVDIEVMRPLGLHSGRWP